MNASQALDKKIEMLRQMRAWEDHTAGHGWEAEAEGWLALARRFDSCDPIVMSDDCFTIVRDAFTEYESEGWIESDLYTPRGIVFLPSPGAVMMVEREEGDGEEEFTLEEFMWIREIDEEQGAGLRMTFFGRVDGQRLAWTWFVQFGETSGNAPIAFAQVFIKISGDKICRRRLTPGDRAARKRFQRAIGPVSDVTVITLRREASTTPSQETDIEWSHRWLVRGHWRNQWYPSIKQHRKRYVPKYIKGPVDKPLIIKTRVFEFNR